MFSLCCTRLTHRAVDIQVDGYRYRCSLVVLPTRVGYGLIMSGCYDAAS